MRQQNYKKDFNGQNIFVGIDVHLKTWSVRTCHGDSS